MTKQQIKDFLVNRTVDEMTRFLLEDYPFSLDKALDVVYTSETFQKLSDEETGLYEQAPAYVYELLQNEYETGGLAKQAVPTT